MKFIDMHCDTLMHAYLRKQETAKEMPESMVDVRRMKEGGALAQFFAMFLLPPGAEKMMGLEKPVDDDEYLDALTAIFNRTMEQCADVIAPARCLADVRRNEEAGKMSGILAIEDGRSVDGKLEKIDKYYDMGVRYISLTWNHENCFGAPNSTDPAIMEKGLTDFGKQAVEYLFQKGILVDVSHLSDGGFADVAALSAKAGKPFVATHSNLRSLSPHQRNLREEMFQTLAERGGVAGINFGPEFLNADIQRKDSTAELMSKHIRRMIELGGEDAVGLGSDFDGIHGQLEIDQVSKMPLLFDRLKKDGLTERQIEKIAYGNVLRVIGEAMR